MARRDETGAIPPDVLYHATEAARLPRIRRRGVLDVRGGRPVFLSRHEGQAWSVAHRVARSEPVVLVVDAARARRDGVRFARGADGLWRTTHVPLRHVLNLHDDYAEQWSAGGLPVHVGAEGARLLLVRVRRGARATWEVAKGKLEPGETPVAAALREVREEVGLDLPLAVVEALGAVRYGFRTPEGAPRLKTLHMFLMATPERVDGFAPRGSEGIEAVGWFSPREAARRVPHRSLRPLMRRVERLLRDDALLERLRAAAAALRPPAAASQRSSGT